MIIKLVCRNIISKPLNASLSLILLVSGVTIISLILHLQAQFESRFTQQMEGIDQVMGAKGSPLQLVLSAVYQIDAPVGNINYLEAQRWMKHPFVEKAIPLSFGDNYAGFRIVGTTPEYIQHYGGLVSKDDIFTNDFEAMIGSEVAKRTGLKKGDSFYSMHGNAETGELHDQHPFKVNAVLNITNTQLDNLIICNLSSYWNMHVIAHEADEEEHDHAHCDHEHHHNEADKMITAVLLKFKNKMATLQWPRMIAENTNMQLASPAIEINRLFTLFGMGAEMLNYLAWGILLLSSLSIFIGLYNNLKERKYELAIIRVGGGARSLLFILVNLESLFLCFIGYLAGSMLAYFLIYLIGEVSVVQYGIAVKPLNLCSSAQGTIFGLILLLGFLASLIPALKAYSMNISKTLAQDK
jgi:putative ABC transport system permease protein